MTFAPVWRACTVMCAVFVLAACGSATVKPKPPALEPLAITSPQPTIRPAWSQRVNAVTFPMSVAAVRGAFTLAAGDGALLSLDAASGRELWRGDAGTKLSAGVGSDGSLSAVVGAGGRLVVVRDGLSLWSRELNVRVSTRPLIAGQRVFVLGTDRSVQAFDGETGMPLWSLRRPGDPLTLNHVGVLLAVDNTLVVGQGARLAGLNPLNGNVDWEVTMATPRGTNEIERLADLVGPAGRVGDVVCARAFQAAVACANAVRGQLLWTRPAAGTQGVATDEQIVVGADANDRITAWRTSTGDVAWTSDALLHRGLSAPVLIGDSVAFGDSEGTIHVLSKANGKTLIRFSTDGTVIQSLAVGTESTLLAVTRGGGIFAFRP